MSEDEPSRRDSYARAGVDVDAGKALVERIRPLAAATARPGSRPDLGGFGAVFDMKAADFADPLLVATTDGVGTKLLLGLEAARLEGLGVDLVAMCANDLVVQGAAPLLFLDYYATGRLEVEKAAEVMAGIARGCRTAGCALAGGETAEMPGVYREGEFDLAGFALGAVERDALLPRHVPEGAVILGLASAGIHANGFSLVRRMIEERGLGLAAPAPFEPARPLAEALLEPTRIYVAACLAAARSGVVPAMAHITGGGLIDNLPRVLGAGQIAMIDARNWPLPPVFAWLAEAGGLTTRELARTFNCGIGMALMVEPGAAGTLRGVLEEAGERVFVIGEVRAAESDAEPRVELLHADEVWPCLPPPS